MDDRKIIELFFERDEKAISEIEKKYGGLCRSVASNILAMREDVEECLEFDSSRASRRSQGVRGKICAQPRARDHP